MLLNPDEEGVNDEDLARSALDFDCSQISGKYELPEDFLLGVMRGVVVSSSDN